MRLVPGAILSVGCVSRPVETPGQQARAGGPIVIVDVEATPTLWSAAPAFSIGRVVMVGDLNGDGVGDASVWVAEADGSGSDHLVLGPLRRSLVLPSDEVATLRDASIVRAPGDVTGDGVPDVEVVVAGTEDLLVVPGPLDGEVDASKVGTPHVGIEYHDLDGDGALDQVRSAAQSFEVTWGPPDRWGQGPDLVVDPKCGDRRDWHDVAPDSWPDITGDGLREWWIAGYGSIWEDPSCNGYLFTLTQDRTVDLDRPQTSGVPSGLFEWAGDQSGDGVADLLHDGSVWVSPVTVDGSTLGGAQSIRVDPALERAYPLGVDVDGDGLDDMLGFDADVNLDHYSDVIGPPDYTSGEVVVVVPGGEGASAGVYARAWDLEGGTLLSAGEPIVEDGVVAVLVRTARGVNVVDISDSKEYTIGRSRRAAPPAR
jgi:hypothetical protein